jgi:putative transposase
MGRLSRPMELAKSLLDENGLESAASHGFEAVVRRCRLEQMLAYPTKICYNRCIEGRTDSWKKERAMPQYSVRRVHLDKTAQLDALAHAAGQVYSRTLVFFWRTVRKQGIWLKPKSLMRLIPNDPEHLLHAHSVDATIQSFYAGLSSWRERRKTDSTARPPRKRKWFFRVEYKRSAMSLKEGKLRLSNGKDNAPLLLDWAWELPKTVVIHWTGSHYEAIATYQLAGPDLPENFFADLPEDRRARKSAGIDLGEVQMAASHDGEHSSIANGRELRTKKQYRNKLLEHLTKKIDRKKKGSRRRKKLIKTKKKQLKKIQHQINEIEHKQTTHLISTLYEEGVQTLVIGDVRDIRQELDVGSNNQRLHQWSFGSVRHKLTYKAERMEMQVVLQEERYTSRTCPACGHRKKRSPKGRNWQCQKCGYQGHRDAVGAMNIRYKHREEFGCPHVVGAMAPPTGLRYAPHTRVARWQPREAARLQPKQSVTGAFLHLYTAKGSIR